MPLPLLPVLATRGRAGNASSEACPFRLLHLAAAILVIYLLHPAPVRGHAHCTAAYDLCNVTRVEDTGATPCYSVNGATLCLPRFYIVGMGKAGTSALWYKLKRHRQVRVTLDKEDCPKQQGVGFTYSVRDTLEWASKFKYTVDDARAGHVLMSACIRFANAEALHGNAYFRMLAESVLQDADAKLILLLRDWPDWMYSVYHYWCNEAYGDASCKHGNWRKPSHHRSAEHFHAFMVANPDWYLDYFRIAYTVLSTTVGRHRLLVVDQGDLLERPLRALRQVERFVGLEEGRYSPNVLQSVINAGSKPGTNMQSNQADVGAASEPMLAATRELLLSRWIHDCHWFQERLGICFASCCSKD